MVTFGKTPISCLLFITFSLQIMMTVGLNRFLNCPHFENYSPCNCFKSNEEYNLKCESVKMSDIKFALSKTKPAEFATIQLTPLESEPTIPFDVLGTNKKVKEAIQLNCPDKTYRMKVDTNAFRAQKNSTKAFVIEKCDLARVDFNFLTGFKNLQTLHFVSNTNFQTSGISKLPALPNLVELHFSHNHGLNSWLNFPILSRGLTTLSFDGNHELSDNGVSTILNWVRQQSTNTLSNITFHNHFHQITKIPSLLTSNGFPNLNNIHFDRNDIHFISAGSLKLLKPLQLTVNSSALENIEHGAFIGDYSQAKVVLANNKLTRFEEGVFKEILTAMAYSSGTLDVRGNPFDCTSDPCHLAWILHDNRVLLNPVKHAVCNNGITFQNLKPSTFSNCHHDQDTTTVHPRRTTKKHGKGTTTIPSSEEFSCPANCGHYHASNECNHFYYLCSNGLPYKTECPKGRFGYPDLVFNPVLGTCDYPFNVDSCEALTIF